MLKRRAVSLIIFVILQTSCASSPRINEDVADFYRRNLLATNDEKLLDGTNVSRDAGSLTYVSGARQIRLFKTKFATKAAADQHLQQRRKSVGTLFQDNIEPYFGLVQKKACVDLAQFSADFVDVSKTERHFAVQMPVDRFLNPFDCDKGLPETHALYFFLSCESRLEVFEMRIYQSASQPFSKTVPLRCG